MYKFSGFVCQIVKVLLPKFFYWNNIGQYLLTYITKCATLASSALLFAFRYADLCEGKICFLKVSIWRSEQKGTGDKSDNTHVYESNEEFYGNSFNFNKETGWEQET